MVIAAALLQGLSFCWHHSAPAGRQPESGRQPPASYARRRAGDPPAPPTPSAPTTPKLRRPRRQLVTTNVYENLVKLDTNLTFQPALAKAGTDRPDRWRFYLRQGVKFHDGTDFTADAVQFSIERIKNPGPISAPPAITPIIAVEIVDDTP